VAVGPNGGVIGGSRGVAVGPRGNVVGGARGVAVGPYGGAVGGSVRYAGAAGGFAYRRVNVGTLPAGYRTINWNGATYCGYPYLPVACRSVDVAGVTYYTGDDVWYRMYWDMGEPVYVVVDDPNVPE
jgi:hypothetical protein